MSEGNTMAEHSHAGEHFREGCPACIAEEHDLVPGALAQRFKDERNVAREQLRGAVDLIEEARACVTAALNCTAHPWHGSDQARRWLMRASNHSGGR